jgi:hypothetical protein
MKTRICTVAVSAAAAISAPFAGAGLPHDATSGLDNAGRHALVIKAPVVKGKSTIQKRTYNPHAYVPGGSSPMVAKAIVAQGQRALR